MCLLSLRGSLSCINILMCTLRGHLQAPFPIKAQSFCFDATRKSQTQSNIFVVNLPHIFSAVSAKIYYASLCVTNEVGRTIVLKPDKGNPQGFEIVPDSTLEVTLMSMSTDGAPIKPVYFIAEDKETFTHLKINDFYKPFPVTPRDGRKPCKTLIVTVARKCLFLLIGLFKI